MSSIASDFRDANKYLEGYFQGDRAKVKENLIVFQAINNLKKCCQFSEIEGENMTTYKGNKLTKRSDGRWVYTKTINKKRVFIYAKTQHELINKIKKYKIRKETVTVESDIDFIDKWYNTTKLPNLSEKTKLIYHNTLNNYIKPFFEKHTLKNVQLFDLQEFVNSIKFERIRIQVYQHIKSIFRYALACGKIKIDITQALILPKRKNIIKRESLTIFEQDILLKAIKGHKLETFIIFSIVIGTRRNETLAFDLSDIDEKKNTLHIKGTKTESADRIIKVSSSMIDFLKRNNVSTPYFNFSEDFVTKNVKRIFKSLNMEHCVHSLRHTCSTNLYYLGIRDKERQHILGHKSIVTTNNIYTSLEQDIKKEDVVKLYNNLYYEFDNNSDNTFLEK